MKGYAYRSPNCFSGVHFPHHDEIPGARLPRLPDLLLPLEKHPFSLLLILSEGRIANCEVNFLRKFRENIADAFRKIT
jgi:hypothetical protein